MFQFIKNQSIRYPWLSISKNNAGVVITSKKIGSRFFEDITIPFGTKKHKSKIISIDFRIDNFEHNNDVDPSIILNNKILEQVTNDNLILSVDDMFSILNVPSISELFSANYLKSNNVFFITRNPIDRFYTGYFEKIDSVVGPDIQTRLADQPQNIIDSILNEHIQKIDYTIFSDEHLSLWNTFLLQLITDNSLQEYATIIDLNDSEKMKIFDKLDQPSNKIWLDNWLSNPNNEHHINELHNKFKFYFELELESYNKLLNKNYE